VAAAKEKLLAAQAEADTAMTNHQKDLAAVDDANKKLTDASSAETPNQTVIDSLTASKETALEAATTSKNALDDKRRRVKSAEEELKHAEARLLDAERGKTAGGVAAAAQIGDVARANVKNTEALAGQVRQIVEDINQSYFIDTCFALVGGTIGHDFDEHRAGFDISTLSLEERERRYDEKTVRDTALKTALEICTDLLRSQIESIKKERAARSNVPAKQAH
jgi:hypothetical protein